MPPRAAAYRRADGLADVVAAEQELPLRNFCGIGPSVGRGDDLHGSERFADKVVHAALLLAAANKLAIRSLISSLARASQRESRSRVTGCLSAASPSVLTACMIASMVD